MFTKLIHFFHTLHSFTFVVYFLHISMIKKNTPGVFLVLVGCFFAFTAQGQQVLTMKEAVQTALNNYGTIKAKASQLNASKAYLKETKSE